MMTYNLEFNEIYGVSVAMATTIYQSSSIYRGLSLSPECNLLQPYTGYITHLRLQVLHLECLVHEFMALTSAIFPLRFSTERNVCNIIENTDTIRVSLY